MRRAVADTDIEDIQLGVVDNGIPNSATTADLPPLTGPGFSGHRHQLIFKAIGGVARNRIKPPRLLAGCGIIGTDITAHPILRSAVADNHFAIGYAWRTGDRIRLVNVCGLRFPSREAADCIDRNEAPIQCADINLILPNSHSAINGTAAIFISSLARHPWVIFPQHLTCAGIKGIHHTPLGTGVHHPINNQRCPLQTIGERCLKKPANA